MSKNTNTPMDTSRKKKKKGKSLGFKVTMTIITIIVFAIAGFAGYSLSLLHKMDNVKLDNKELGIVSKDELTKYKDASSIKNIALFGIDAEEGLAGRSDAIVIATIDSVHDKVKITSLMRDSYVNIEGYGMDKLNHAYAFGGPTLAIKTINENFGLNVEDFVTVNFSSLPEIVESFNGVELNITDEEVSQVSGVSSGGTQLLNGAQVLDYSRIRVIGNDFERTHRQRLVLTALFKKGIAMPVTSYPGLLNEILPYIQTSLDGSDILSIATNVTKIGNGNLEEQRFPQDADLLPDEDPRASFVNFNSEVTRRKVQDYIFDDKQE